MTTETKCFISFTVSKNKFCSINYNGSNSSLFANGVEMYQLKPKSQK